MGPLWLGIDLGGTNAKAAVVDDDGGVVATFSLPMDTSEGGLAPEPVVAKLLAAATGALADAQVGWLDVAGVGIGSPGKLDIAQGVVNVAANLFPGVEDVPLCAMLRAGIPVDSSNPLPVVLINDADAAVAAECWVGVGRDKGPETIKNMVFLTLGTGIGAGIVIEGKILAGATGTIEGGHMLVEADNPRDCGCNSKGCLEAYASATSVAKRAAEAMTAAHADDPAYRESSPWLSSIEPGDVTCKDVFDAAKKGDELGLGLVNETAKYLAVGCTNFSRILDTEAIVLSGGMVAAGPILIEAVEREILKLKWCLPIPQRVLASEAGPHAGLIGAASAARSRSRGAGDPAPAALVPIRVDAPSMSLNRVVGALVAGTVLGLLLARRV